MRPWSDSGSDALPEHELASARVDPKLRAITEMILAMPIDERLRQLQAEAEFFSAVRPIDD